MTCRTCRHGHQAVYELHIVRRCGLHGRVVADTDTCSEWRPRQRTAPAPVAPAHSRITTRDDSHD